jgi:2-C-methyl-D-erythritol 4-phosphate cytidylyltransferase/2-C-methyl-D-erythritol 2,4-cyclodiphosphate synthase
LSGGAAAVICAAGSSARMNGNMPGGVKKEYRFLGAGYVDAAGKPLTVLGAAVTAFAACAHIDPIVIVIPGGDEAAAKAALPRSLLAEREGRVCFVSGGSTRRQSVLNALVYLRSFKPKPDYVLIHDGGRPWVSTALIDRVLDAAREQGAAVPIMPLVETPKEVDFFPGAGGGPGGKSVIRRHLRRGKVGTAQTPQGFSFERILAAHEQAAAAGREYTDDAEIWGEFAGTAAVVSGDAANKKITYPEDLVAPGGQRIFRTGLGRDLHRLVAGRRFVLGGVEIPSDKGFLGHSDGDVLAHAAADAILGAAGLGDIGEFFPDTDPAWKDADSMELLAACRAKVEEAGWAIVNIDCVVTCERPKILPYRDKIRASLAAALGIDPAAVFVKGKTNEGIGETGRGEAVEALAMCLVISRKE